MPATVIRSSWSWISILVPAILLPAGALWGAEADPVADIAPVQLFIVTKEGLLPAASRDPDEAKAHSEEYAAKRDELQEQRAALFRELKKSHGKMRAWPPTAMASVAEVDYTIAELLHAYHPRLNLEETVAPATDWVVKFVEGGDYPGFLGEVRSPLVRVGTSEEAHLVIEVQGRYGPFALSGLPGYGLPEYPHQGVCLRVSAGGLWGGAGLESLSWPERVEHKKRIGQVHVFMFHRATADEPYWEGHVTALLNSPPYARLSGVAVVMVLDELVQTNPTRFGGSAP